MRLTHLCSAAIVALSVPAQAQELDQWQPSDCASFEPNSLEAALLDCDEQALPAEEAGSRPEWNDPNDLGWSDPAPAAQDRAIAEADEVPLEDPAPPARAIEVDEAEGTVREEPVIPDAYEADLAEREELERRPVARPEKVETVERPDDADEEYADRAVVTEVEEPIARMSPERAERRRERQEAREERRRERAREQDEERAGRAGDLDIPPGHLPPPGECRLWFPDRSAGHQPPPTSCDVRVPNGAVLIYG